MAEYRLDELARVSGVSARNIRAYRERGLLDPPRRQGRSAYYNDFHLAQLETIDQLLRKGFNSAHIAEFFASMREGADLAEFLGLQRAVLGPRPNAPGAPAAAGGGRQTVPLEVDGAAREVRQLVALGLAETRPDGAVVTDGAIGAIVSGAPDPLFFVRVVLQIVESTRETIDDLAAEVVQTMQDSVAARFGPNFVPKPEEIAELRELVEDYRDLANKVVASELERALQHQMVTAASDYTAGILLTGHWEPKHP